MNFKAIGLALLAGIAAFLVVGIAVTELLSPRIEFSLFVGIPAGLMAGVVAAAAVALWFGREDAGARRAAVALGAFGGAFLATTVAVGILAGVGLLASMLAGGVVGLAAAVLGYLRGPGGRSGTPA